MVGGKKEKIETQSQTEVCKKGPHILKKSNTKKEPPENK